MYIMEDTPEKKPKLNTTRALITVVLYLVGSIVAGVLAAIFFGGAGDVYWIDAVSIVKVTATSSSASEQGNSPPIVTTANGLLGGLTEPEFDSILIGTVPDGTDIGTEAAQEQLFLPFVTR